VTDILDTIDEVLAGRCAGPGCDALLDPGGVSAWFHDPDCQRRWAAQHAHRPDEVLARPDAAVVRRASAARWVPPKSASRPPRPDGHRTACSTSGVPLDPELVREALARLAVDLRPTMERIGAALRTLAEQLGPLLPPPVPADPMLAAIEAKRHRNTGPRPQRRAPRRIDPRGTR
jgi:hypothetical protein